MRRVWSHAFTLHASGLVEAAQDPKRLKEAFDLFDQLVPEPQRTHGGLPIALRWSHTPTLGIPRRPFQVFRRSRAGLETVTLVGEPSTFFSGSRIFDWGGAEMYYVVVQAEADPGMVLDAIDREGEAIPGQRIAIPGGRIVRFHCPGIVAIRARATGTGRIVAISGAEQTEYANLSDWQLIEVVGLPYLAGEVAPPVYTAAAQGPAPPSKTGFDAARMRLAIARVLWVGPPATGIASLPVPPWSAPDPDRYLKLLRDPRISAGAPVLAPLGLVTECLTRSDDSLGNLQAGVIHAQTLTGLRQADIAAPPSRGNEDLAVSRASLPIVGMTMLQVASDSWSATGLGYGTIDLPPKLPSTPPRTSGVLPHATTPIASPPGGIADFDYMVTATFAIPFLGTVELAALSSERPAPELPAITGVATSRVLRAPSRDQAANETVQLQWRLSTLPQGYGALVGRAAGSVAVLNAPRPLGAGGYDPFIPQRPRSVDGDPVADARTTFIDPVAPRAISGSLTSLYAVAGVDVFGRWSSWAIAPHTVTAPAVITPGLHSIAFVSEVAPVDRAAVPYVVEIEVSWDWTDRSPARIELVGAFHAPDAAPPPAAALTGVQLSPGGAAGTPLVLQFNAATLEATVTSGHTATVVTLDDAPEPPDPTAPLPPPEHVPVVKRYRIRLGGATGNFLASGTLAYSLYAHGAEAVRPAEASEWVAPRRTVVHDPMPPAQPAISAELRWTALPDATGRARGRLTWSSIPHADGYVVWEATEASLRKAIDPAAGDPDPAAGDPDPAATPRQRADALIAGLAAAGDAARVRINTTFRRLNTSAIGDTALEVELPGEADTLFAYRVSAVNATQVESTRSDAAVFFAVPRRRRPGQPLLIARRSTAPDGFRLIALPGPGAPPAGYRAHRVQDPVLAGDLGTMGPAVIAASAPWTPTTVTSLDPSAASDQGLAIVDPVAESWYPYYYRVVALGASDPANGVYAGESDPSAAQRAERPPSAPPVVAMVSFAGNATNRVLMYRSDLPVKPTVLGQAQIELYRVDVAGARATRTLLRTFLAADVAVGPPLAVLPTPSAAELAAMPQLQRGAPDPTGTATYTLRMHDVSSGIVVARDPLGRATELSFEVT